MLVRVVLVLGALAIAAGFGVDMSGRAVRMAGTDHVSAAAFVATVPSNGELCQPEMVLPPDAHGVELLIGTYGHPVPKLTASFSAAGKQIASGRQLPGAREGYVEVPLDNPRTSPVAGTLCLKVGRAAHTVVFGGEQSIAGSGSEQINGVPAPGRIALIYKRAAPESWWQLLPILSERFGVGKTSFFGDWTLAAMALLVAGVVIAALRLLARELT